MRLIAAIALLTLTANAAAAERFISTKGEATVEVPPDFVRIELTLMAIGADSDAIKADVDGRADRVLAAAAKLQVAGADITSSGVQVEREYETDRNDNDVLRGYRVSRDITIKLRAIEKYEAFAQALVDAGVDEVSEVKGDVNDLTALKQRALIAASANARSKAQAIAGELGIKLGTPIEVGEERLWFRQPLTQRASSSYESIVVTGSRVSKAQLVFRPHDIKMDAVVWVRFEIAPGAGP